MKTQITEILNISEPILMGGMQWIGRAELVAAVSEAGGAGFIPAATFETVDELADEIRKTKELTKKPFGVNISILPDVKPSQLKEVLDTVISEGIPFVETSGMCQKEVMDALKKAGIKILHKVTAPKHAKTAEREGADAIILVGYEGAGHPGLDQVGTFVDLPKTVDSVSIPVVAAGGICDGKSMAAAFALGAEGVLMGTRFIATKECPVHDNFKNWIVNAEMKDTLIIQRSIRNAFRAIKNEKAEQVLGLENCGATLAELLPHISGKKGREALINGDMDHAVLTAGQCIGRIDEILTVNELFIKMKAEYESTIERFK